MFQDLSRKGNLILPSPQPTVMDVSGETAGITKEDEDCVWIPIG